MPTRTAMEASFTYRATVLRYNARTTTQTRLLRETVPVEILELSQDEAPLSLFAELKRRGSPDASRIVLRHDGRSYLRPVVWPPGSEHAGLPFETDDLREMLDMSGAPTLDPIDAPTTWLTKDTAVRRGYPHPRTVPPATHEDRVPVRSDRESAREAALAEADGFVLVGGELYRRTAAPVLCWEHPPTPEGEVPARPPVPILADAALRTSMRTELGTRAKWWPISCAPRFLDLIEGADWELTVEAPLETDHSTGIAEIGEAYLPYVDDAVDHALGALSDAGLEFYKDYRRQRLLAGDADAAVLAMEAARAMAADIDRSGDPDARLANLSTTVAGLLPHWDALLDATGRAVLDRRDEVALLTFVAP